MIYQSENDLSIGAVPESHINPMLSVYCCFQYRHGYGSMTCPVCEEPITRVRTPNDLQNPIMCQMRNMRKDFDCLTLQKRVFTRCISKIMPPVKRC